MRRNTASGLRLSLVTYDLYAPCAQSAPSLSCSHLCIFSFQNERVLYRTTSSGLRLGLVTYLLYAPCAQSAPSLSCSRLRVFSFQTSAYCIVILRQAYVWAWSRTFCTLPAPNPRLPCLARISVFFPFQTSVYSIVILRQAYV